MSAASQEKRSIDSADNWQMKADEIEQAIDKVTRDVALLNKRLGDAKARRQEIASRRSLLLAGTTSRQVPEAEEELNRLRGEDATIEHNIRDDEERLARCTQMKQLFERNLAAAQWERDRCALRLKLKAHAESDLERRIMAAVGELRSLCAEIARRNEDTAQAVLRFDPSLVHEAARVKKSHAGLGERIGAELADFVPVALDARYRHNLRQGDPSEAMRRRIEEVLSCIDCMGLAS